MAAAGAGSAPPDGRFVYFNNLRAHGKRGVGFGGSLRSFRLFVEPSLERGMCRDSCETYADGALTAAAEVALTAIEVWGCGGRLAKLAQEEWKEERGAVRRRVVRRGIVGDAPDAAEGELSRRNRGGVVGGAAKEDSWMLGLLGLFGASDVVRHTR